MITDYFDRLSFLTVDTSGSVRLDGIVSSLIYWWMENDDTLHTSGSSFCLSEVANRCEFASLKREEVGLTLMSACPYKNRFIEFVSRSSIGVFFLQILKDADDDLARAVVNPHGYKQTDEIIHYRLKEAVGMKLMKSSWWKENEYKLKKHVKNINSVKKIMES